MKKICIFIEHIDGVPTSNSKKIIFMAQTLRRKYGYVIVAVVIDKNPEKFISYLRCIQVDSIYCVKIKERKKIYYSKSEIKRIINFLKNMDLDIVWATNNSSFRILFPKIAYGLQTGLCAACSDFRFDTASGRIFMNRIILGNSAYAQIDVYKSKPLMATILDDKKDYILDNKLNDPKIYDITTQILLDVSNNSKIEMITKEEATCINKSKIVIGLGNGIGNKSDLAIFKELSKMLGNAAIGGTRELVNRKIIPRNCQIGSTGMQIWADMYIAFGISGAPQHIQGIESVKKIIAVNNDPYAAIFQYSDYGIVGDLYETANYMIKYLGGKTIYGS